MDLNESTPSLRKALAEFLTFYIPLAVQGISMSLTYPLVGSIVSHGRFGAEEYSVFAQAQTVMFLVASVGTGLVTTGMIFARTRTGMRNFTHLSFFLVLVAAGCFGIPVWRDGVLGYGVQAFLSFSVCILAPMFWVILGLSFARPPDQNPREVRKPAA